MNVLPLDESHNILEINAAWREYKTIIQFEGHIASIFSEQLTLPLSFVTTPHTPKVQSAGYILNSYVLNSPLPPSHPVVKAAQLFKSFFKFQLKDNNQLRYETRAFSQPQILDLQAPAQIDFDNQFEIDEYLIKKEEFDTYVKNFKSFIDISDKYIKALDELPYYSEDFANYCTYIKDSQGRTIDLQYLYEAMYPKEEIISMIDYWREWIKNPHTMIAEQGSHTTFEKLFYLPILEQFEVAYLILGYDQDIEQYNIYFTHNQEIFRTMSVEHSGAIYLNIENAIEKLTSPIMYPAFTETGYLFVAEYVNGVMDRVHNFSRNPLSGEEVTKKILDKFKLERALPQAQLSPSAAVTVRKKNKL